MSRPIKADSPKTRERLTELAEILAAGLMRALAQKSSPKSSGPGDVLLDFSGKQSGHAAPLDRRMQDV